MSQDDEQGRQRHPMTRDPRHGHLRFDPPPAAEEVEEFYRTRYEALARRGERAPDLRRLRDGGEKADEERAWLRRTLHADVAHLLRRHAPGRRVIDVGCGTGDLMGHLAREGYEPVGVEPSPMADEARRLGFEVTKGEVGAFPVPETGFDAAVMLNVLEHVHDPAVTLATIRRLLAPGGVLLVRVPNDFSPLQEAALGEVGGDPWWVCWPDHLSYFDFTSLRSLLEAEGFAWLEAMGDFPMEMFLLMGDDYTRDPELGSACHRKRRSFELALQAEVRRDLYRALAQAGMGRNCLVAGRLEGGGG